MKTALRRPDAPLAGCVWLARLTDKARLYLAGSLEVSYAGMFCARHGVDGSFLEHFALTKNELLDAVVATHGGDALMAHWFSTRETVTPGAISFWNRLAPQLGRAGQAGEVALRWSRQHAYKNCTDPRVDSLFLAIAWDEGYLEDMLSGAKMRAKPRLFDSRPPMTPAPVASVEIWA